MSSIRLRRVVVCASLVLASSSFIAPGTASAVSNSNCIAQASSAASPATAKVQCYDSFAEAIAAASGGRVQLSPDAPVGLLPAPTGQGGASPATSYILGIDYTGTSFTGGSLTWYESTPCGSYSASSMPTGWNDVISSVANYSGCGSTLYQNINFGGTTHSVGVNGSASTLGTFNGQASSQKWCTSSSC